MRESANRGMGMKAEFQSWEGRQELQQVHLHNGGAVGVSKWGMTEGRVLVDRVADKTSRSLQRCTAHVNLLY